MPEFSIIDKDGSETFYPSVNLHEEIVFKEKEPEKTKKDFYLACVTMANAWLGCFAFWLPCLLYLSEHGGISVGGLFWLQICLCWNFIVILHNYKKLKNELN